MRLLCHCYLGNTSIDNKFVFVLMQISLEVDLENQHHVAKDNEWLAN